MSRSHQQPIASFFKKAAPPVAVDELMRPPAKKAREAPPEKSAVVPMEVEEAEPQLTEPAQRSSLGPVRYSTQFFVDAKQFNKQYASIYFCRLNTLRPVVLERVQSKWLADHKDAQLCDRISAIQGGKELILVGTIYKDMKLKPCILDEYDKTSNKGVPPASFVSSDDFLILEDESGRVKLVLKPTVHIDVASLISGVVAAVRGRESAGGDFEVEDILFAGLPDQAALPTAGLGKAGVPRYVVLMSGIRFGHPETDPLPMQLMIDYLSGLLGNSTDQRINACVERVIIAGDSLNDLPADEDATYKKRILARNRLVAPLKELDMFLTQLASSVEVDILPGPSDPSNLSLPQQPLHRCLFPSASMYSSFHSNTNPAEFTVDDTLCVLGTSGQNISDMARFSNAHDPVEYLARCLEWRHLAPSAPDTLACYPFQDSDPFVVSKCPHIFFAGNQKSFGTRLLKGHRGQAVRLVCVPDFFTTHSIVFVNVDDLECHQMSFGAPSSASAQ